MSSQRPILLLAGALLSVSLLPVQTSASDDRAATGFTVLREAERMAHEAFLPLSGGTDECDLVARLANNASVRALQADLGLAVASCVNEESATQTKFMECLGEVFDEFAEGLEELEEINEARLELCDLTGGGIYDPDLDEDAFVEGVNHTFSPFLEGAEWIYQKMTPEGLEEITVTVTGNTRVIDDIECIEVLDVVKLDGVKIEDTLDWYAQHEDGTVWYMGEISQNFDDEGRLEDLDGSWLAGEDGALPGIVMLADPTLPSVVGTTYRQELLLTEAEDAGTVLAVDQTVTIGIGTYFGCLQTEDFTPIEPGNTEYKFYAPGVGLILEVDPATGDRLELMSFTPGS